MKKLLLFLVLIVTINVSAQSTTWFSKPLELDKVPASTSKSDSVLVRGTDKIIKFVPRSEFTGGSQNINQVLTTGNVVSENIDIFFELPEGQSDANLSIGAGGINMENHDDDRNNAVFNTSLISINSVEDHTYLTPYGLNLAKNNEPPIVLRTDGNSTGELVNVKLRPLAGIVALLSDIPTIIPTSETQSGIVDNTSLQELGGVDKYINGVRIGKGNNTASTSNTVIGSNALMASTTATSNTAIGRSTLALATTGSFNTAVGAVSLANLTTGTQNVGLGGGALRNLTTGGFNLGIGTNALVNNITGIRNTAIGAGTGIAVTGNNNTAIGYLAMGMSNVVSTGELNIALGFQAGGQLTSGSGNILIENQQLFASTITTGSGNVILKQGLASTGVTTGNNNTVIGNVTGLPTDASNLALLSDGSGNIAIRKEADNRLLAPTLTNALIDSGGAKSLVTKEYLSAIPIPTLQQIIAGTGGNSYTGTKGIQVRNVDYIGSFGGEYIGLFDTSISKSYLNMEIINETTANNKYLGLSLGMSRSDGTEFAQAVLAANPNTNTGVSRGVFYLPENSNDPKTLATTDNLKKIIADSSTTAPTTSAELNSLYPNAKEGDEVTFLDSTPYSLICKKLLSGWVMYQVGKLP